MFSLLFSLSKCLLTKTILDWSICDLNVGNLTSEFQVFLYYFISQINRLLFVNMILILLKQYLQIVHVAGNFLGNCLSN